MDVRRSQTKRRADSNRSRGANRTRRRAGQLPGTNRGSGNQQACNRRKSSGERLQAKCRGLAAQIAGKPATCNATRKCDQRSIPRADRERLLGRSPGPKPRVRRAGAELSGHVCELARARRASRLPFGGFRYANPLQPGLAATELPLLFPARQEQEPWVAIIPTMTGETVRPVDPAW
jgi:hypothetical protein